MSTCVDETTNITTLFVNFQSSAGAVYSYEFNALLALVADGVYHSGAAVSMGFRIHTGMIIRFLHIPSIQFLL
jgi:hypothetical protein